MIVEEYSTGYGKSHGEQSILCCQEKFGLSLISKIKDREVRVCLKMYVRCPIDHDMINPRIFLWTDNKSRWFSDIVEVVFNDPFGYRNYYGNFSESSNPSDFGKIKMSVFNELMREVGA